MREFSKRDGPLSVCSRCNRRPPRFENVCARWEYRDAVADAIRRIKYGGDFPALRALCRGADRWMEQQLDRLPDSVPVIPVPAHRRELQRRGFHLPTLALRYLQRRGVDLRIVSRLRKTAPTPCQAGLSLQERRRNVRGVFEDGGQTPEHATALLFDDVMTSGATADAASRTLLEAGFEEIRVAVLARAPYPGAA